MISVVIKDSDRIITTKINKTLASMFNQTLSTQANTIKSELRVLIRGTLMSSREIFSLSGGVLKLDFGLTSDPSAQIVDSIVNSLDINITKVTGSSAGIRGGITITLQPTDYSNLLSLPIARQTIEGGSLPWLEWLLTLGDAIIIADFGVKYEAGTGRTGGAHMTRKKRPFKVNTAFSGTAENNFISRAINSIEPQIMQTIIKAFK